MRIIEGKFDPITQGELEYLLQYRKEHHINDLFIAVEEEGVLSYQQRYDLVKRSIAPYRHLHMYVGNQTKEKMPNEFEDVEKQVRQGAFYLSAKGIRKQLNENGHYYENIAKVLCNEHRYLHSVSVANTASKLAQLHQLDAHLAYRMGLLHDITKRWSDEEGKRLLEIYDRSRLETHPKVWHSFTAPIFIQKNLCMNDPRILNAIWHHTLGDGKSDYDHILYIADKIEPLRGYDASKEWALAAINLKEAAHYVLEKSKAYRKQTEGE